MCDAAMRPAITQHKLDEVKAATGKRNGDMVNDPSFMASEGVVAAAYSGALARPVLWTGAPITPETLQDFHAHVRFLGQNAVLFALQLRSHADVCFMCCRCVRVCHTRVALLRHGQLALLLRSLHSAQNIHVKLASALQTFTPSNTTMAISGTPVSTAESLANDFLGGIPSSPTPPKAPSTYVGGGSSEHYTANATAVVAFETDGWAAMDNSVLSTVVRAHLSSTAQLDMSDIQCAIAPSSQALNSKLRAQWPNATTVPLQFASCQQIQRRRRCRQSDWICFLSQVTAQLASIVAELVP